MTILACASEFKSNLKIAKEETCQIMYQCHSYYFQNILLTYNELEWASQTRKEWYDRSRLASFPSHSSFESMIYILLQRVSNNTQPTGDRLQTQERQDPYGTHADTCLLLSL